MADRKPPRSVAGERETLLGLLQFQRESIVRKVTGVSDENAVWSPVGSGTSMLWLIKHLAKAEINWILVRFAGEKAEVPDEEVRDGDTLAAAIDGYRTVWALVEPVLTRASLDDQLRETAGLPQATLRWVIGHLLEETARHAGHADILRELLDGEIGR
jgi:hypothetical protein